MLYWDMIGINHQHSHITRRGTYSSYPDFGILILLIFISSEEEIRINQARSKFNNDLLMLFSQ